MVFEKTEQNHNKVITVIKVSLLVNTVACLTVHSTN